MTKNHASDLVVHLQEAITYKTICPTEDQPRNEEAFEAFLAFLERTYKRVHRMCKVVPINRFSRIYHLKGKEEGPPILLLGHYDVVPVEEATRDAWSVAPFSGTLQDGYVYGRGTLDDKNQVLVILEVLEEVLAKGHLPRRDVYVALGFDEETGGELGAKAMAAYFEKEGITFDFVLDEGGAVMEEAMEGLKKPLALIGVAEKGSTMIRLKAKGEGGHSSMPPQDGALLTLSRAIMNLSYRPMKPKITPPVKAMFQGLAPYMGMKGILLKNIGPLFSYLTSTLEKSTTMNSLIRTTLTPTYMRGGEAYNVLPQEARAVINARILPGETTGDVLKHLEEINGGLHVQYEFLEKEEASTISPHEGPAWELLEKCIFQVFPEAKVLPYLMAGGTDSRKYEGLSDQIYRFSAVKLTKEDLQRIHGTDERISIENLEAMQCFYETLLQNL